jgi:hypothetical protein
MLRLGNVSHNHFDLSIPFSEDWLMADTVAGLLSNGTSDFILDDDQKC